MNSLQYSTLTYPTEFLHLGLEQFCSFHLTSTFDIFKISGFCVVFTGKQEQSPRSHKLYYYRFVSRVNRSLCGCNNCYVFRATLEPRCYWTSFYRIFRHRKLCQCKLFNGSSCGTEVTVTCWLVALTAFHQCYERQTLQAGFSLQSSVLSQKHGPAKFVLEGCPFEILERIVQYETHS